MKSEKRLYSNKSNMSISVPFVSQWEALLSTFMDKVLDKNFSSKAELVSLWNHTIGNPSSEVIPVTTQVTTKPVESSKPVETVKTAEAKPVASKANATCPFVITRGDKMGEKCGSGLRPGMNFCMKHNKDKPKVPEKDTTDEEKSSVKSVKSSPIIKSTEPTRDKTEKMESMTSSQKLEQEFKRKEQQKKLMITESISGNTVIKGTMVVVNAQQQIIGYLQDKNVVHGTSAEVEKASKEYGVQINRSQWKVHIDELSI
jgi:hypothetical protein